jgi:AcrR family transcriptional regulator
MGSSSKRVRRPTRGALSREALAEVVLSMVDRRGLEAVTLRALAAEVGVASPMALSTCFSSKDDLVAALRERVVDRLRTERPGPTAWQALLEATAHGLARAARAHPHWLPLVFQAGAPPPSLLGYAETLIELMREDGFSLADALRAHVAVLSFALGSAWVEQGLSAAAGQAALAKRLSLLQHVVARAPAGRSASLAAVAAQFDRFSFDDTFTLGLQALLVGIEAQRRPASRRR